MDAYMSIENDSNFIPLHIAKQWVTSHMQSGTRFFDSQMILCIQDGDKDYILKDDMDYYANLVKINSNITEYDRQRFGGEGNLFSKFVKISDHTAIYLPDEPMVKPLPAFVRNLFYYSELLDSSHTLKRIPARFEVLGVIVITYESSVELYLEQMIQRKRELDRVRHSNFVNTTSYMGNKKRIAGFIIESMFPHLSKDSIFVDLMCGSGAMSQAFAQLGLTYASDAQNFCQLLAKIQGYGFSQIKAQQVLQKIGPYYHEHVQLLTNLFQTQLKGEEALYLLDWSDPEKVFSSYMAFSNQFQLYSSTAPINPELDELVSKYKENPQKKPYCLFTLYFSNVFFGLMQCIQLDSLRYAVDQLEGEEKTWALGVLVVTTYQVSSSHAGHFAQPRKLSVDNILKTLSQRKKSAFHEFSKRFLCLAEESEQCPNEIKLIAGPWQNALDFAEKDLGKHAVIYLDAPYKRDEYSRYYHVLETMVKYDYPSSEYNGHLRSKKLGERFSTEFFTKTSSKIDGIFADIITRIIKSGMVCVWSYSNNGDASIIDVIDRVRSQVQCKIHLYGVPYQHQAQRRAGHSLKVMEYCIVFSQKNSNV